jgi:peroxiredoxin Q/BCP
MVLQGMVRSVFVSRPGRGWTAALVLGVAGVVGAVGQTPAIGAKAPDFTLATPLGAQVTLAREEGSGPVVLVVLRGYPGYQCPYCVRQVHDFIEHAAEFAAKHAEVLLVYPGPPAELDQKAKEFLAKQAELPPNVKLVIDPDYGMTNKYGLRWDAPKETAYPSTFILDRKGVVVFEKISKEHGGRTSAADVLGAMGK